MAEESHSAEIVEAGEDPGGGLARQDAVEARLARLRAELHEGAAIRQLAVQQWARVDDDQEQPPLEWVEAFGPDRAKEMLRIALAARLPSKDAPVALRMNAELLRGLEAARAASKGGGTIGPVVQIIIGDEPEPLPVRVLAKGNG